MMKKVLCVFCCTIFLLLTACSDSEQFSSENPQLSQQTGVYNQKVPIYNEKEELLCELERYGLIWPVEGKLLYSKIPNPPVESFTEKEYCLCDPETGESKSLGIIDGWSYEAGYNNFYRDGHFYMMVTIGNVLDENATETEVALYDIDIQKETMQKLLSWKDSFPYSLMAQVDNRIIFANTGLKGGSNEGCHIEEYNFDTKELRRVRDYDFDEEKGSGDSLRHIASDGEYIYIVRLHVLSQDEEVLLMDVYDKDFHLIKTEDLTPLWEKAPDQYEPEMEIGQGITCFLTGNNSFYYENMSITTFLGKIEDGEIQNLLPMSYKKNYTVTEDCIPIPDTWMIHDRLISENNIFRYSWKEGKLEKASFRSQEDGRYCLWSMCRDSSRNKLLISMETSKEVNLPPRAYYIDESSLDFKPYTPPVSEEKEETVAP